MKKFSNISSKKPLIVEKENKESTGNMGKVDIKYVINHLLEEFLKIRIEGPLDPILMSTILIDGKEEFINALLDVLKKDELKDQIKLLEQVKYVGIDNYINNLESVYENYRLTPSEKSKHSKRINDLIEKADGDLAKLITDTERQAERITTGEKAYYRAITAESMLNSDRTNNKFLKEIAKIFKFRAQQLGYNI